MTAQTKETLKTVFEQGDKPQGSDYVNLIDSSLNLADTTAQTITSNVVLPSLNATVEVSSPVGKFGTVDASASAVFGGPMVVGGANRRGRLVLVQQTTVTRTQSAATTIASLPANSDVLEFYIHCTQAFGTTDGVVNLRLGVSGKETFFNTVALSGVGIYRAAAVTVSALDWLNITTNVHVMAVVTAQGSATTPGQALINVIYLQKSTN